MSEFFESSTVRHGTHSGWTKHMKSGERPCDPCYAAKQAYDHRRKLATKQQLQNRRNAKAQNRAKTRLTRMYLEQYQMLYAEEKQRLLDEEGE